MHFSTQHLIGGTEELAHGIARTSSLLDSTGGLILVFYFGVSEDASIMVLFSS
jgi:hypothetical protein